jgi:general secretion pathway protein M
VTAFRAWWISRTLRERRLLVVMLALIAIVIFWLGILRPVTDGLADAKAAHLAAIDRTAAIEAGVELLQGAQPPAAPAEGPLDQFVAQSAASAGFTLDSNTPAGADVVSLAIGSARAPALLAWLGSLEGGGLTIDSVTIQPGPNRTVSARVTLRRTTP